MRERLREVAGVCGSPGLPRRVFLKGMLAGGALAAGSSLVLTHGLAAGADLSRPAYSGPNVILVRFGGGARRRETIDPENTYAPFLCHDFLKRGTLYSRMEI